MHMGFRQQRAVVTGGESGIGKACALALGRSGAVVVLTFLHDHAAAAAVVTAIEASGGRALARQANIGEESEVDALFGAAEAALEPVRLAGGRRSLYHPR